MKYKINDNLVENSKNSLLILISLENKDVHCSNDVGVLIWDGLKNNLSEEEIIKSVTDNYDVDHQIAKKDFDEFIDSLINNNLISKVE